MVKKTKKQGNNYFTDETEEAIIRYNSEDNYIKKNIIYEHYIHYPLFKLTQNIIHTFKFYNTEVEDLEHLQHELIIFFLSKIHLFNPAKSVEDKINKLYKEHNLNINNIQFREYLIHVGLENHAFKLSDIKEYFKIIQPPKELEEELLKINIPKAYSYFGTMIKRWLIMYNNKNYNSKIINISISNPTENEFSDHIEEQINEHNNKNDYSDELEYFIQEYTKYCSDNIEKLFPKKQDIQIADAILELFRNKENIDIFNKKALYIYIREIIDVKTPKITKIANELYAIFKKHYSFYIENDYINFPN